MGSPADIKESTGGSGGAGEPLGTLGVTRADTLAVEIPINATGTRPGSGPDKRELFTEETVTVLVFPDGAVIRLSAAVATGQLIFITNKNTNMEVVSQVVGKRVYRPTSCYVELKFTEEIAGFWGVEFPKTPKEKPKAEAAAPDAANGSAAEESIAGEVESAEKIEESGVPEPATPTGKEVEELRGEVEALRRQLGEMKRAEAAAKAVANMTAPTENTPAARSGSSEILEPAYESKPTKIANVSAPTPEPVAPPVPVVTPEPVATRKSHVAMSLPNRPAVKIDPEQEVIDQLLPRPELDFSNAPIPSKYRDPNDPYSIYKPTRAKMGKWTLVLLLFVLVGAIGLGAWKLGFVQRLVRSAEQENLAAGEAKPVAATKVAEVPKSAAPLVTANDSGAAATVANVPASAPAAAMVPKADASVPAAGNAEVNASESESVAAAEPAKKAREKVAARHEEVARRPNVATKKTAGAATKKKPVATDQVPEAPVEVGPVVENAPLMPAKLVKSVSPAYPPDAMRNFITGDVKLKAEVDERGHIRNVEVVSGPKALRESAIEAFKQYEYEPATKGGKSVASQVKVTIKFWFVP